MSFPDSSFLPDINQPQGNHARPNTRDGQDARGRTVTHLPTPPTSSRRPPLPQDTQSSSHATVSRTRRRNISATNSANTSPSHRGGPSHPYNSETSSQRGSGVYSALPPQSSLSRENPRGPIFRRRDPSRGGSDGGSSSTSSTSSTIPTSRSREPTPFGTPDGSPLANGGFNPAPNTLFTQNPPPLELINTSPLEFTQAPIVRNRTPAPPISQNLVQVNRISSGPSERLSSENQSTMMASTEYFEGTGMSKEDWMRLIRDYREKTK